MLFFGGGLGLLFVAFWLYCLIDVITVPSAGVRNLPKLAWVFIVILLFEIGGAAWLLFGRPRGRALGAPVGDVTGKPTTTASRRRMNPDDDEAFLASLRARAEEQRRRAREQQPPPDPSA